MIPQTTSITTKTSNTPATPSERKSRAEKSGAAFQKNEIGESLSQGGLFLVTLAAVFALVAVVGEGGLFFVFVAFFALVAVISEGGLFFVLVAFFAFVAVVNEGGLFFVVTLVFALILAVIGKGEWSGQEGDKRSGEEQFHDMVCWFLVKNEGVYPSIR
jgi:hypothetical protein